MLFVGYLYAIVRLSLYSFFFFFFFRRKKWVINTRCKDLTAENVGVRRICSVHFECKAYNCPKDIAQSSLLPTAVPTIVDCPNPPEPIEGKRKPPRERPAPVPKKRRVERGASCTDMPEIPSHDVADTGNDEVEKIEDLVARLQKEIVELKAQLEESNRREANLRPQLSTEQIAKKSVQEKLNGALARCVRKEKAVIQFGKLLEDVRKTKFTDLLKDLPDIPRAVIGSLCSPLISSTLRMLS